MGVVFIALPLKTFPRTHDSIMKDHDPAAQNFTFATRSISFLDPRPPQEIRVSLERDLMVLLSAVVEDAWLVMCGSLKVNGATCSVVLRFDAAGARTNGYSLKFEMSWAELPPDSHAYHRHAAGGWFDLWTRNFTEARESLPKNNSSKRYIAQMAEAIGAEWHLTSIEAVQQEILIAMRAGGSFSTAHKEGGTVLSFLRGLFIRADYGESQNRVEFADETSFLAALRNLYQWETGRSFHPDQPSEYVRWKLILRLLRTQSQSGCNGTSDGRRSPQLWIVILVAIIMGGGFAVLRNRRFRPNPPPPMEKFNGTPPKFIPPPQVPEMRKPVLDR